MRQALTVLVVVAVIALVVWGLLHHGEPTTQPAGPASQAAKAPAGGGAEKPGGAGAKLPGDGAKLPGGAANAPATNSAKGQPKPATPKVKLPGAEAATAGRDRALKMLAEGLKLNGDDKLIEARAALADALNSGALPPGQADSARKHLAELADKTILSPRVHPKDPCTFWYRFEAGEVLVRVERRKLKLHVPGRLILAINGIADARQIRAGQNLKMIRGPFHAVVSKGRFTMDVYLAEPTGARMIFIRRFGVGVGKDGSTPPGMWQVSVGRKMVRAPWSPPLSSKLPPQKILWGQQGYPLGAKGYWIGLEGVYGNPHTAEDGYGIHGTDDAASIGKASSLGCIRLRDVDIEEVYSMLYPKWSKVSVRP